MSKKEKTLTSIDYIILGLLQSSELTGYGIRKIFETTALGNYSSSPGTIYPALKRLQKVGLIENVENNGKTVFQIRESGTAALLEWLQNSITQDDIQRRMAELILRFAFMNELTAIEIQIQFLEQLIENIKIYLQQLEQFYKLAKPDMDITSQLAFEHGLSSYRNDLNWAKKALKLLQSW